MNRGFTLLETMVAVTISLVLGTTLLLAVNNFFAGEKVKTAATELVSYLNDARNIAITGQGPSGFEVDYVAVVLNSDGTVLAFPVNIGGTGVMYFSKKISDSPIVSSQINFGELQFAAGSGKLLGKNGGNFGSYPLPSTTSVGITISTGEADDVAGVIINAFGTVTLQ